MRQAYICKPAGGGSHKYGFISFQRLSDAKRVVALSPINLDSDFSSPITFQVSFIKYKPQYDKKLKTQKKEGPKQDDLEARELAKKIRSREIFRMEFSNNGQNNDKNSPLKSGLVTKKSVIDAIDRLHGSYALYVIKQESPQTAMKSYKIILDDVPRTAYPK